MTDYIVTRGKAFQRRADWAESFDKCGGDQVGRQNNWADSAVCAEE